MSEDRTSQAAKRLRWTARGAGSLLAAFWLFMGIASGISESEPFTLESAIMTALIIATALGVLIAWRRERLGGTILVIVALAHSIFAAFAAGRNHAFAMLISGGPWLVVGLLFLASWQRSKHSGSSLGDVSH